MNLQLFQPSLGDAEAAAVKATMQSNWLGRGPQVAAFEAAWAKHVGVQPAQIIATTCATEALFTMLALLTQSVGGRAETTFLTPGDEVILPTISFVGAANAIVAAGLRPVFCDVDGQTLNATAATLEAAATPRARAVLVQHYGGAPADMTAIGAFCATRGWWLLEDAACAPTATWGGQAVGTLGAMGCWSLDAMKVMSTGEGGLLFVRDLSEARRARQILYLGLDEVSGQASGRDRWWEFQVTCAGRRAVMNDLTATIGNVQLARLPELVGWRQGVVAGYRAGLGDLPWLRLPPAPLPLAQTTPYLFPVQCAARDALAQWLRGAGVYTSFRYYPLHQVAFYGQTALALPGAEQAARKTLLLPLHAGLGADDVAYVVELVRDFGTAYGL